MSAWEIYFGENPSDWDFILSFDTEEFPEAHSVEVVQFVGMPVWVDGSGFASI